MHGEDPHRPSEFCSDDDALPGPAESHQPDLSGGAFAVRSGLVVDLDGDVDAAAPPSPVMRAVERLAGRRTILPQERIDHR